MTSEQLHLKKIKEHIEEIDDAILKGIEERPITIGFHCSACAIELLELYLHKLNKISPGKIIKHDWFKRPLPNQKIPPLIERKLPVQFKDKEKIYNLIYAIEEKRNNLLYGKSSITDVKAVLNAFIKLRKLFKKKFEEEFGLELEFL